MVNADLHAGLFDTDPFYAGIAERNAGIAQF